MDKNSLVLAAACALALGIAAPAHARDDGNQATSPGNASSNEQGRMTREDSPAQANKADTSPTAEKPLPQGTNPVTTNPAESQVGADPKKSKAKRNPAAQTPADPVEATPPSADAHADGARGPRGDDESRARANVPEYNGPVQKPGEPADPNVRKQESGQQAR